MNVILLEKKVRALTHVELLVVLVVIAVLAAMLLLALAEAKKKSLRIHCVNQLNQICAAFRLWPGSMQENYPMQVDVSNGGLRGFPGTPEAYRYFQVLSNELGGPKLLVCPADIRQPAKDLGPGFSNTNISYFVGIDADDNYPQMLLCGDRNITGGRRLPNGILEITSNSVVGWSAEMHRNLGNVAFTDSHVETLTTARLRECVTNTDMATNHLAIP